MWCLAQLLWLQFTYLFTIRIVQYIFEERKYRKDKDKLNVRGFKRGLTCIVKQLVMISSFLVGFLDVSCIYKACQSGEGKFLIIKVGSSFCYKWVLILNGVSM